MAQQKQRCPLAPNCPDGQEFHYSGTRVLAEHATLATKQTTRGADSGAAFTPSSLSSSRQRELTDEEIDQMTDDVFDSLRAHDVNFPMEKISSGEYSYAMAWRGVDQSHNIKSLIEDSIRDGDPLTMEFSPTAEDELAKSLVNDSVVEPVQSEFPDSGKWSADNGIVTVEFNPEEHNFEDLMDAIDEIGRSADEGVLIDESDYLGAQHDSALEALSNDERFSDIDTELLPDLASFVTEFVEMDKDGTYDLEYVEGIQEEADRLREAQSY